MSNLKILGIGNALVDIMVLVDDDQIIKRVRERCAALKVTIPVSVALPGRLIENLFGETVWSGTDA